MPIVRQARGRTVWLLIALMLVLALPAPAHGATDTTGGNQVSTGWILRLHPGAASWGAGVVRAAVGDAALAPLQVGAGVYLAQFDGATRASDGVARLLANRAVVDYVEPDVRYAFAWEPNDTYFRDQTWAKLVHLPDAWSIATGQPSTIVAVVDSGVRADHPDLQGKVLAGHDFLGNSDKPVDDIGHGTMVAGIIAARGNDGVGIAGAAMDVSILPVRVGNADGAPVSAIAQGVVYAVDHGASVINLSLGADTPSPTLENAIDYAYRHDVVVVAAAGNSPEHASFPATYAQPISVGAASGDGSAVAPFSSRVSRVDLTAPGDLVLSSSWSAGSGNGWDAGRGTSFAAPIVSGTIALMRAVNPGMSIEAIRAALTGTVQQTYPAGTAGGGAGLLDAAAALRRALLPSFAATWAPADQPVAAGAAHRTWLWGPHAFGVTTESYADTQRGERLVAYYDKSRMEITDPYEDRTMAWYVTNGLLVTEMIRGQVQVGMDDFQAAEPATVPVAGDPDDASGPLYASFTGLTGAPALADGSVVVQTIDRGGSVGADGRLADYGVRAIDYVPETGHRIASVFAAYLASDGLIAQAGQFLEAPLFDPPFYATGYPITEPYWARVKVAGQVEDVLVQCFQRRCLTYTPSNDAGWQVEMGNVGQHYYRWRFGEPPAGSAAEDPALLAGLR